MSISPTEPPLETAPDETERALRLAIFGERAPMYAHVQQIVAGLGDTPESGFTYSQQADDAADFLRAAIGELGPASRIARDHELRGALCDAAQVVAPRLLLILTGHFDLAVGAILALGNGSEYQQRCLEELDSGAALGVLLLTELGGTNGADQTTTAEWDPATRGFYLHTPSAASVKFMPNVAAEGVPKNTIVTARVIVDGRDEGVMPFLLRLRLPGGALAEGVEVVRLPEKYGAPMDHAMIRFDRVWVPADALLGGDWARMADGRFECTLEPRARFHAAISALGNGRLDLATASLAGARAAIAGLVNYAQQRAPSGKRMRERDQVQLELVSALSATYAASVLGRRIREMRAAGTTVDAVQALWSMVLKPLASYTSRDVLTVLRERAGAQGALRTNHFPDWQANTAAIVTAEGENQIMLATAGRSPELTSLQLPSMPAVLPWFVELLVKRETALAQAFSQGRFDTIAVGRDSAAIQVATATGERLAATALAAEAATTVDATARRLLEALAAVYALEQVSANALWYVGHGLLSPADAKTVATDLSRHYRLLSGHLEILSDAFDVPDLPGPMFSPDYIAAWADYACWVHSTFADTAPQQQP